MSRAKERADVLDTAARLPDTIYGRVVAQGPVAVERYLDYIGVIDAGSSLAAHTLDLRRWQQHPEVCDAVREARAALMVAYSRMGDVVWKRLRDGAA